MLLFAISLASTGCKKEEPGKAKDDRADQGNLPADKKRTGGEKKGEPAVADSAQTGIPECDEYLTKYARCIDEKFPVEQRQQMKQGLAQTAEAWKAAKDRAADIKTQMAAACKEALDAQKETCGW